MCAWRLVRATGGPGSRAIAFRSRASIISLQHVAAIHELGLIVSNDAEVSRHDWPQYGGYANHRKIRCCGSRKKETGLPQDSRNCPAAVSSAERSIQLNTFVLQSRATEVG